MKVEGKPGLEEKSLKLPSYKQPNSWGWVRWLDTGSGENAFLAELFMPSPKQQMSNLSSQKWTQVGTCAFKERILKAHGQFIIVSCQSGSFYKMRLGPLWGAIALTSSRGATGHMTMLIPLAFSSQRDRMSPIVSKYPAANAYTLPSCFLSKRDFSNTYSSMFHIPSFGKALKVETPAPNQYNVRTRHVLTKHILSGWFTKTKGRKGALWETGP